MSEVRKPAPIATVMLPEANAFEALVQHLSGKRAARLQNTQSFRFKKFILMRN